MYFICGKENNDAVSYWTADNLYTVCETSCYIRPRDAYVDLSCEISKYHALYSLYWRTT